MRVTLRYDHTVVDGNFTLGTNQLAAGSSLQASGHTQRRVNAKGTSIRLRKLHLRFRTNRAQNRKFEGRLRSNNLHLLRTGKLAGLREILFRGELIILTKQRIQILLGQVNMTCRGLNHNFHCTHSPIFLMIK